MANRHLFRSILLQTLFEWDIRGYHDDMIPEYLAYNVRSFNAVDDEDLEKMQDVLENVAKKHTVLDDIITNAAPDWPLDKITIIDRNILRLGLYELLFGDQELVPPKVAINEAVELGKRFGGPKSNKFINGVIGAVYREIGEPGKDDSAKEPIQDVPYEEMPIDQKGGAVIYSVDNYGTVRICMVHDVFGYWTLSKGGIEENETAEQGTVREVKEETNLDVTIIQKLGENEYIAYHPERGPVRKQVQYFLAQSEYSEPQLENDSGGLDDVRWFGLADITDLNIYDDVSQMLIKSIEIITANGQATE